MRRCCHLPIPLRSCELRPRQGRNTQPIQFRYLFYFFFFEHATQVQIQCHPQNKCVSPPKCSVSAVCVMALWILEKKLWQNVAVIYEFHKKSLFWFACLNMYIHNFPNKKNDAMLEPSPPSHRLTLKLYSRVIYLSFLIQYHPVKLLLPNFLMTFPDAKNPRSIEWPFSP